jgi:uncharacterized protein
MTTNETTAPAFFEQTWDLSYRHALGATVGGFLEGLKSRKLLGRRCPECGRVLFPARSFCDRCHVETTDWVEVGISGRLEMFTIVYEPFPGRLVALGYVKGLDLTDVTVASKVLEVGTPLEVHFVEQPEGKVTDFWYEVSSPRDSK